MPDNPVVVFPSDGPNRQHTGGENWPFVLLGNLGGRLKTGRLVAYPMQERGTKGDWSYHGNASAIMIPSPAGTRAWLHPSRERASTT